MEFITEGKNAIEFLTNNESIISGEVRSISVYRKNDRLYIDIEIKLTYSKIIETVLVRLEDVMEYSFYYDSSNNFYYIEDFKLFKADERIYVSLDPSDSSKDQRDKHDNDFALAKGISIYSQTHSDLESRLE